MTARREFMRNATLLGVALAFPGAEWLEEAVDGDRASDALASRGDDESYWRLVRSQFIISPRGIYFNTGTVGASPRVVLDAVIEHLTAFETVFDQRGVDLSALRRAVGSLVGAPPHTLVFTRNTTEGMNFVANGLDLEPGDEILTTTHEHVGGLCPWQLVARRRRLVVTQFPLPVPPRRSRDVLEAWRRAISPRTKVLMISHVLFTNGLIQPVRELCALARERGLITAIDGAHPPGMLALNLQEMDCDFYATSPHKWLLAPKGSGLLYVNERWLERLWPTIASGGWDDLTLRAERFDRLGTRNDSLLAGFGAAVDFHETIGRQRVERRLRWLGNRLYEGLVRIDGLEMKSATDESIRAPLITFALRGWPTEDLIRGLGERATVRVRHVREYDYQWVRMSTHVYNTPEEVDRVVGIVGELARSRG